MHILKMKSICAAYVHAHLQISMAQSRISCMYKFAHLILEFECLDVYQWFTMCFKAQYELKIHFTHSHTRLHMHISAHIDFAEY